MLGRATAFRPAISTFTNGSMALRRMSVMTPKLLQNPSKTVWGENIPQVQRWGEQHSWTRDAKTAGLTRHELNVLARENAGCESTPHTPHKEGTFFDENQNLTAFYLIFFNFLVKRFRPNSLRLFRYNDSGRYLPRRHPRQELPTTGSLRLRGVHACVPLHLRAPLHAGFHGECGEKDV